jgi:hypothetical protein
MLAILIKKFEKVIQIENLPLYNLVFSFLSNNNHNNKDNTTFK